MVAADGRVVWFHDEAQLIRDIEGTPVTWQGVMVDVTERREAETELQRAQERLQALIDHIPAVVYREALDADPTKFFLSTQVEQMLGHTVEEWTWIPDFWVDHVHPDDRERVLAVDAEANRTHGPTRSSIGSGGPTTLRLAPGRGRVPAAGPRAGGLVAGPVVRRDRAEGGRGAAARQSARAQRDRRAPAAIVYREPPERADLQEMYIGPQVEQISATPPRSGSRGCPSSGRSTSTPTTSRPCSPPTGPPTKRRRRSAQDYRFRHHDGRYLWVHDEATFVSDIGGGWWQGFIIDVTARKEAEEQLREAEEKFRTIVEQSPAVIYTQEYRPRGSERLAHDLHLAGSKPTCSATPRGGPGRPDPVVAHDPPRRPGPRARRRRREQPRAATVASASSTG